MTVVVVRSLMPGLNPSSATATLSLLLLSTAASAEPRRPTHVACVGDSITVGGRASSEAKNYVSQLQVLLGDSVEVENFGKGSATLLSAPFGDKPYRDQDEFTQATEFVDQAPPGAVVSVIIVLGANDSKPNNWQGNAQQYLEDYRELVDHFTALSSKPTVYVGYPLATGKNPCCKISGDLIKEEQIPLIDQVAEERRLPIIDLHTGTAGHPEYFADGVHPNDDGYLVMAQLAQAGLAREPSVQLTGPAASAVLSDPVVSLTAEAKDETVDLVRVEFFSGATSIGVVSVPPFTLNWTAPAGAHTVTAMATDSTDATGTSGALTFTVADNPVASGGNGGAPNTQGGAPNTQGGAPNTQEGGAPPAAPTAPSPASGGAAPQPLTNPSSASTDSGCRIPRRAPSSPGRFGGFALLAWGVLFYRRFRINGQRNG